MDEEFFTEHCIFDNQCESCPLRNSQLSCCLRSRDRYMQFGSEGSPKVFGKVNWIAEFSKYSSLHVSYRRFVSYSTVNQLLRSSRLIFKSSLPSQDPLRGDKVVSSLILEHPSPLRSAQKKLSFSDPVKSYQHEMHISNQPQRKFTTSRARWNAVKSRKMTAVAKKSLKKWHYMCFE